MKTAVVLGYNWETRVAIVRYPTGKTGLMAGGFVQTPEGVFPTAGWSYGADARWTPCGWVAVSATDAKINGVLPRKGQTIGGRLSWTVGDDPLWVAPVGATVPVLTGTEGWCQGFGSGPTSWAAARAAEAQCRACGPLMLSIERPV